MTEIRALELKAVDVRTDIIEMVSRGKGTAHPAPALSCADILTALYYGVMNTDARNPRWEGRDRLILSKGHACPALYSVLENRGFFPREDIYSLRGCGSILQGHPDMKKTPGVDMTSGSLGHGLAAGVGMALGLRLSRNPARVYVVLGDGETQEGIVWEAAMSASKYRLDNLITIMDYNHLQSSGFVEDNMPIEPVADKWRAFGFKVLEVNGHDMADLLRVFALAKVIKGAPVLILAHTTKGKDVSFMENNPIWHSKMPTEEEYRQAISELEEKRAALTRS